MDQDRPYLSLVRPWTPSDERELASTAVFTVRERTWASTSDPSKSGAYSFLDCDTWANVVALTPDRRVVMVEQFRHGLAEVTLELPGGIVDPGEEPAEACRRELLEETGFAGDAVEVIGAVSANPAIQNNRCHFGLVRNAAPAGGQDLDEREEVAVRLVPLDDIPALIRGGTIHHAFVVAAFLHLALRQGAA